MAYATVDDLISLFGENETRTLSGCDFDEEINGPALELAIGYASSEVDSYLAGRYAVPLAAPVPPVVMMVTADIVRYRLTSGDVSEKDPVAARYKTTVAWLRDVASGVVSLPCAGTTPGETSGGVEITPGTRDW